jgi:hypothetical protein
MAQTQLINPNSQNNRGNDYPGNDSLNKKGDWWKDVVWNTIGPSDAHAAEASQKKPLELNARVTWYRWTGQKTASGVYPELGAFTPENPGTLAVPGTGFWPSGDLRGPPYFPFGTRIDIEGIGTFIVRDTCPECTWGHPLFRLPYGADIRIDVYGIGADLGVRKIWVYRW